VGDRDRPDKREAEAESLVRLSGAAPAAVAAVEGLEQVDGSVMIDVSAAVFDPEP
jgi:hypothetical protein